MKIVDERALHVLQEFVHMEHEITNCFFDNSLAIIYKPHLFPLLMFYITRAPQQLNMI